VVVQAWIRTGTEDSLLRAEAWAFRTLDEARADPSDSGVVSYLQTFLPIISAWAHSRDRNGPQNVQEWIEHLEKLGGGGTMPQLKPTGGVQGAIILAWRKYHLLSSSIADSGGVVLSIGGTDGMSHGFDGTVATETYHLSVADKCSECLEIICEDLPVEQPETTGGYNPSQPQQPSYYPTEHVFHNIVDAWRDVATCTAMADEEKDQRAILAEIFWVVRLLDDQIGFFRSLNGVEDWRREATGGIDDVDDDGEDNNDDDENDDDDDDNDDHMDGRVEDRSLQQLAFAAHRNELLGLIEESQTTYRSVISHISTIGNNTTATGNDSRHHHHSDSGDLNFVEQNFHHVKRMLRRSEDYTTLPFLARPSPLTTAPHPPTADTPHTNPQPHRPSPIRNHDLYSATFRCCCLLTSPTRYGDTIRVIM